MKNGISQNLKCYNFTRHICKCILQVPLRPVPGRFQEPEQDAHGQAVGAAVRGRGGVAPAAGELRP